MEAATGFEPVNNGFADRPLSHLGMPPDTSTADPADGRKQGSGRRDLNPRQPPWQGGALPAELLPLFVGARRHYNRPYRASTAF